MPGASVPELVEDAVAVGLLHLGVDVEARVAQLGDLLGQQLDAVHRVAEDDGLVDLELQEVQVRTTSGRVLSPPHTWACTWLRSHLGEECVEAVDLLSLVHEGVVLRDAAQRQLLHQVDLVGVLDEPVLQTTDTPNQT